ncbi:MAG: FMN-binding protein [Kordiimonadaceae bacterium]|nr:FMN-binding protein [Kordiimonadaceae bacterium]
MPSFARRSFLKTSLLAAASLVLTVSPKVWAKTYLSIDQARKLIWGDTPMVSTNIVLTKGQRKAIKKASRVRVRSAKVTAWKTEDGGWFIVDQVIGKHENIDIAVGLDSSGKVMGIEILVYRETYGYQIANPKWRAQFTGKDNSEHLKLDKQIRNISGATLSCRHITDGINRLTHTWDIILKAL